MSTQETASQTREKQQIEMAAKVAGQNTISTTYLLKYPIIIGIVLTALTSLVMAAVGAYQSGLSLTDNNSVLATIFAVLIAFLSEVLANFFFYVGFASLASWYIARQKANNLYIGIVVLVVGMLVYYSVTFRYTSKGFNHVSSNVDNSQQINLTYKSKLDSLTKIHNSTIDSLNKQLSANYVKLDSAVIAELSKNIINVYENRVSFTRSLITKIQGEWVDTKENLIYDLNSSNADNSEILISTQNDYFNFGLITLFGSPLLIALYVLFYMLVRKEQQLSETEVLEQIIKRQQDELIELKKKVV